MMDNLLASKIPTMPLGWSSYIDKLVTFDTAMHNSIPIVRLIVQGNDPMLWAWGWGKYLQRHLLT